MEGARHEGRTKIELAKQTAADLATNASNAVKNRAEVTAWKLERLAADIKEAFDESPEVADLKEIYRDLHTAAKALQVKTSESVGKAWETYRKAQKYLARHGMAARAASHAYRDVFKAVSMDAGMVAEGLGRSRSVKG